MCIYSMSIFKSHIDAMTAYAPPLEGRDPEKFTLLDFNERTLPLGKVVEDALVAYIRSGRLQMYPSYSDVVARIADYVGVPSEQVMITNGSDQGIDLIFRSACSPGDEVIIPGPSFAMYGQCAKIENTTIISPSYTREGGYPKADVLAAINEKTRLIVISNPNNPCGTLVSPEAIREVALAAPHAVILVDECYFEYSKTTVVDVVAELTNVLVTRTFSKTWGMPSLRLGYIVAAEENIRALLNVRGPYDVNQMAIVAIKAALTDIENVNAYIDEVMLVSKVQLESYLDAKNIEYWPSSANYVWAFFNNAKELELALRAADILVRAKMDANGRLGLRMTLGTEVQMRALLAVLDQHV